MNDEFNQLHAALLDLVGFLNRSRPDHALLQQAGIELDHALFPLLVGIERRGPLGVVELADLAGRDYTTICRQVAKLEQLGLVTRQTSPTDSRVREATITAKGQEMTNALDVARQQLVASILVDWNDQDIHDLVRLMRRLADDAVAWVSRADTSP